MNKRLWEIYGESLIGTSESNTDVLDPEKFAELIVNECMELISDESEKVSGEWRCKDGQHIWWKVKEHFGVEE